jgi:hypothetical protein
MKKRSLLSAPQQLAYSHKAPPHLHEDAVTPDGLPIVVEWDKLDVGASVFIPAVNLTKLSNQIRDVARRKQMTVKGFTRIEAGKYGMRFWRIA